MATAAVDAGVLGVATFLAIGDALAAFVVGGADAVAAGFADDDDDVDVDVVVVAVLLVTVVVNVADGCLGAGGFDFLCGGGSGRWLLDASPLSLLPDIFCSPSLISITSLGCNSCKLID